MARTPDGPAPAPAVQRLRVHYAKRGRLRFASHRDFARAFERAVRRAGVPIAFSAGFSPHPKVSYANAAPTGVASEAEYLEIGVVERCDPERVRAALDASLPPGLDILEVVEAGPGSLADRLEASRWRVVLPGLSAAVVGDAVAAFLGRDEVVVERLTKNGVRSFDARSAVLAADVAEVATACGRARARRHPGCGSVCDTAHGRPACDTRRSTRRCPRGPAPRGRPRASRPCPGDTAGAGATRRGDRRDRRPTCARPGLIPRRRRTQASAATAVAATEPASPRRSRTAHGPAHRPAEAQAAATRPPRRCERMLDETSPNPTPETPEAPAARPRRRAASRPAGPPADTPAEAPAAAEAAARPRRPRPRRRPRRRRPRRPPRRRPRRSRQGPAKKATAKKAAPADEAADEAVGPRPPPASGPPRSPPLSLPWSQAKSPAPRRMRAPRPRWPFPCSSRPPTPPPPCAPAAAPARRRRREAPRGRVRGGRGRGAHDRRRGHRRGDRDRRR